MKKIKKNYVLIGTLALMIALCGYLNFSANRKGNEDVEVASGEETIYDLSEEDLQNGTFNLKETDEFQNLALTGNTDTQDLSDALLQEQAGTGVTGDAAANGEITDYGELADNTDYLEYEDMENEDNTYSETALLSEENGDIVSVEEDTMAQANGADMAEQSSGELTIEDTPGEAVFTSGMGITSLASARLIKEQTRAQNKSALLEIINSDSADAASKEEATANMIALMEQAEKETSAEILLEAKGFTETVVSISGDSVDVIVGVSSLTDDQCAQIIDVVSRKTGFAAEQIIITPVGAEN
ncbi:MAG: SpoIIIAH-like family protein [Lachnospiraceae bacterium]